MDIDPKQLEERLSSIERKLSQIEEELRSSPTTPPVTHRPVSTVLPKSSPPKTTQPLSPWPAAAVVEEEEKPGNWLGAMAVICFILAAGFIIKLSIDSGWLTPARQVGLAVLLGLSFIGAGIALLNSDKKYASLLPGAGIIILYLSNFAAHRYYELISFESALAMTSVVSALCVGLYLKIWHDTYPITAAVGAYLSPVILDFNDVSLFSIYYFLLCSVAFATISIWLQSRTLTMVASYLAIILTAFVGLSLQQDTAIAVVMALHFVVFSIGTYCYARFTNESLTENESWSFLPVLLLFYAMEYYFIHRIVPDLAPWFSLGFAGLLIGLYFSARNWFLGHTLGSQGVITAFTVVVCFHSIYLELLPNDFRPWLFVIAMMGAIFVPIKQTTDKFKASFGLPIFAILAILVIEYLRMLFYLFDGYHLNWLLIAFSSVISMWALIIAKHEELTKEHSYGHGILAAAHILTVLALYRLVYDFGSLAVSASWLLYAVAVMVLAFSRKDEVMAKSTMCVLGFAAGKVLLYDASSAPAVIRIICLLLTGVVLYGSGFFMRKIKGWKV